MKKIAVLTSGGDAPGMNAAIRAVVRSGIYRKVKVYGIDQGYKGLLENRFREMTLGSVGDIIHRGGTILRTARSMEFMEEKGVLQAVSNLKEQGIEGLIVIGGDGSIHGARSLEEKGFPTISIPATIDNDVGCTDHTIGFSTALNTVCDAINKVRDTATSHGRVFLIEVMGRECGYLALMAGLAGGAESVLIPEVKTDLDSVVRKIRSGMERGKLHSIILVAEGFGDIFEISKYLKVKGHETRNIVLGHIQRGGTPSAEDRNLASLMGGKAVELLLKGEHGLMTGFMHNQVEGYPYDEVLKKQNFIDHDVYELMKILSI